MPLFLCIDPTVPDDILECCLDDLHKAMASEPVDPRGIWRPHPNPYLVTLIEDLSGRFQRALEVCQGTFSEALTGEPLARLGKALGWMEWNEQAYATAREHLQGREPSQYDLEDWLLLVDVIIGQVMPPEWIDASAEDLATRGALLGHIQAVLPAHQPLDLATLRHLTELVPTRYARVPPKVLTPVELATLHVAKASAAIHISDVTEKTRSRIKRLVVENVQGMLHGQPDGDTNRLALRLFDEFSILNRDFRRIALSETGEAFNQGYVQAMPLGKRLMRVEAYEDACSFCRELNGKVFTVVSPNAADKDGATQIWEGKTNAGRSAAASKRQGDELVPRAASERWWCAAGIQHPNCRGRWVAAPYAPPEAGVPDLAPAVSPVFKAWLGDLIAEARQRSAPPPTPA